MFARALAPTRVVVPIVLGSLLAASLLVTVASQVRAATITVNTTADELNDDGDCSLREAIEAANTDAQVDECVAGPDPTDDVISVPAGPYTLAIEGSGEDNNQTGDLDLNQSADGEVGDHVTINGAGAATTIIDGADLDRIFDVQGGSATLTGMTIRNGTSSNGGGVRADDGSVTITDAVISGNVSDGDRRGGGLYVHSSVSALLQRVTVSGNAAFEGGGIYNNSDGADGEDGGTAGLIIEDSTISGNTAEARKGGGNGGGIFNDDDASLLGTTVTGNTAQGSGGGIFNDGVDDNAFGPSGAALVVSASTISGNDAQDEGGGIFNHGGDMAVTDSTISDNDSLTEDGGGIGSLTVELIGQNDVVTIAGYEARLMGQVQEDTVPTMAIVGTTISGNRSADDAGGLENDGEALILNSTISGNTAADEAGGVYNDGDLNMSFTTVASNTAQGGAGSGGGLFNDEARFVALYASLIVNNSDEDCFDDGFIASQGSNMDSDESCDLGAAGDQSGVADPKIGPLADNDGPTLTHALLFDSDAVDAVEPAVSVITRTEFLLAGGPVLPTCPPADQRGATVGPRPVDGDGDGTPLCDIGAFELQPPSATINDVNVIEGNSGTVDAVFTVTLSRPTEGTVTFAYATANGSAVTPADYQPATGVVTFTSPATTQTITVRVEGDTVDEPNETFTVTLTAPVGATLADAQGVGTIVDDEGPIVMPTQAPVLSDTSAAGEPMDLGGAPVLGAVLAAAFGATLIWGRRRVRARG